jgi:hypothetical protein
MNDFKYPASDLDDPRALFRLMGSFWTESYQGSDLVLTICAARMAAERQTQKDLDELVAAASRIDCPVLHHEDWHPLTLLESAKNPDGFSLARFGDAGRVFELGSLKFGVPQATSLHAWALPAGMVDAPMVVNRISDPSRTLVRGVDYQVADGYIVFRDDPFADPLVPRRELFKGNAVVDREAGLWACGGKFDRRTLYRMFGYVLRLRLTSSQPYKDLLNAMFDMLVEGSVSQRVRQAWAAATGVPLVRNPQETVVVVRDEGDRKLVVTDQEAYAYAPAATVTVVPGQTVQQHEHLTDALTFYEFNRGQCPAYAEVKALAIGRGFLAAGFFGDLVFENAEVPLVVESDADGNTKVSFKVDGWPGDVERFFDELHARGLAAG